MDELKKCPFCGGTAKISDRLEVEGTSIKTLYHIWCSACGVRTGDYETNYSAIMVWNRRVDDK